MKPAIVRSSLVVAGLLQTLAASAGSPEVVDVKVACPYQRHCNFSVTLRHADAGWDHYADRWEVLTPDGELLATRKLWHPHVNEQPFTRSLEKVPVPLGLDKVKVRAHDSVHGYGVKDVDVALPPR